jgi:hypothetical protein
MMGFGVMMFNATYNNISVVSWRSVLLVEEAGASGENYRIAASLFGFQYFYYESTYNVMKVIPETRRAL